MAMLSIFSNILKIFADINEIIMVLMCPSYVHSLIFEHSARRLHAAQLEEDWIIVRQEMSVLAYAKTPATGIL